MNRIVPLLTGLALASAAAPVLAQDLTTDQVGPLPVTGNVPALCSAGAVQGEDSVFGVGVLIDTATGLLLEDLDAPDKIVVGSFCNAQSTITIEAEPMLAQAFTGTPPDGFTDTVNFTATASGWTATPAVTSTGSASNPDATQARTSAFTGDITVGVQDFAPSDAGLRPLADPSYLGSVTITLAIAE